MKEGAEDVDAASECVINELWFAMSRAGRSIGTESCATQNMEPNQLLFDSEIRISENLDDHLRHHAAFPRSDGGPTTPAMPANLSPRDNTKEFPLVHATPRQTQTTIRLWS
jgi:hypothetical protein